MKFLFGVLILAFVFSSCKKTTLDATKLKKVILLQVDYLTNKFEGGKEFSYFLNDTSTVDLPLTTYYPFPENQLSVLYMNDTIFDGIQNYNGVGEKIYPKNIDPQILYYRLKDSLATPIESRFQVAFYDLGFEPILYDSIWKRLSNLSIVDDYQSSNNTAKIGIFLFRPSAGGTATKEDWKWYVIMKN